MVGRLVPPPPGLGGETVKPKAGVVSAERSVEEADGGGGQAAGGWLPGVSFKPADNDYVTVMLLAAGLARMRDDRRRMDAGEHLRRTSAEQGLLPAPWRSGMARLWWRFHRAGAPPPASDLELLELCRQPLGSWPVRLCLSAADQGMSLLDGDDLSPLAEQAAQLTVRDVEAELVEHQIFRELLLTAEMNASDEVQVQANYVDLRRLLIDHSVLADRDVQRLVLIGLRPWWGGRRGSRSCAGRGRRGWCVGCADTSARTEASISPRPCCGLSCICVRWCRWSWLVLSVGAWIGCGPSPTRGRPPRWCPCRG